MFLDNSEHMEVTKMTVEVTIPLLKFIVFLFERMDEDHAILRASRKLWLKNGKKKDMWVECFRYSTELYREWEPNREILGLKKLGQDNLKFL